MEEVVQDGQLSELDQKTILDLLYKSMIRVTSKNEQLTKVVSEMAMPIIECEFEKADRLEKELKEAIEKKIVMLKEKNAAIEEKDAVIEKKDAVIKEKDAAIKEKDAMISADKKEINEQAERVAELEAIIKKHGLTV